MMPLSTDSVTGSTPETVLCKSLIHSYQIGKLGPNPTGGLVFYWSLVAAAAATLHFILHNFKIISPARP